MPEELAELVGSKHPTHMSTEPTLRILDDNTHPELRTRGKLIDDLYSITGKL